MLSFRYYAPIPCRRRFLHPAPMAALVRFITSTHPLAEGRRKKKLASSSENEAVVSEASKFSVTYPENYRLFPCPSTTAPPRIEHLVVLEGGSVSEYISKALVLPPLYVADLIRIGAVYYALVPPKPPPTATPEQIRLYEQFTTPEFLKERHSIKRKTLQEAQKTFRITHVDEYVEPGTYLRVYVHPRRFPRCYEIDWSSRIVAISDSYVVLDKPAGTSVGGTSNNIEESCATFATRALGLSDLLRTTHQIDNCTEGCVVLARTKEYCSVFHGLIREGKVKKLYLALAAAPVPVGVITHYMRREVPWPNSFMQEAYNIEDCGWPRKNFAYECTINLLTGRTHQIRAQLAACGAPIVGDSMYMPASVAEMENSGVNPFGRCKKEYTDDSDKQMAIENWVALHGKEPPIAIGLQACQISWDNGGPIYKAGCPWWR